MNDFTVTNHGSIFLLTPMNEVASEWIEDNLPEDRQTLGLAVAVEHRYIADIVNGIRHEGLTVS